MDKILYNLKMEINEKLFIKDPETSALGKKIIQESIVMIHELGFEQFTFRKLGSKIGSNESSIYRYFENKHKLLLYLASWYWSWLEHQMVFQTMAIHEPREKLLKAIDIITADTVQDSTYQHVDEILLNKIVISEHSKSYLTKEVDRENKDGYFQVYKRLASRIGDMISALNPDYPYPASLSSMIIDGALHQHYLKEHFKVITDCGAKVSPSKYFKDLINRVL
ncbi:TetR family transcriptional regulator [Nonlabens spongiae]|uniref:TetR family transcriptional regulator n=1 Tax=Nonlabens spongiae TaxID=331648 RepID=A0A1W6MH83_9FLAO|nr:TetR/AcrR family transcriptional regulator [Nonlabens spongiae]ARN76961.1 TetR family transcriptional regulator [Nonlabens spongiae]